MTGATTGAPVRMLSIHPLISVRKLLIFLHELDNIDKHRVLHVANLAGYSSVAFVPAGSQEAISLHTTQPQRITVTESDIHEAANAVGMHTTTVRLAEEEFCGGQHIWGLCDQLYNYVRNDVIAAGSPCSGSTGRTFAR